ncbi:MAG TPA: hypothetical protein VM535_01740 [Candidatus Saccharimonadales bacterium]|nr:hypothetical protein [Candidatus Saccharimonadales bacterium]
MSSTGEGSPFDFGVETADQLPSYDSVRIAEQAVWPTVDHLWRNNWREESVTGQELTFPAVGLQDGVVYDIRLDAGCYRLSTEASGCHVLAHTVRLRLKEEATDGVDDLVFNHAAQGNSETLAELSRDESLVAKKGIEYLFDSEEEAEINAFQSIDDADGMELWVSDYLDEEALGDLDEFDDAIDDIIYDTDRFYRHDVENISMALSILGAPESCLRALQIIKSQPVNGDE